MLRALQQARKMIHGTEPDADASPWPELNLLLGQATREFRNSVRNELGVSGPIAAWHGRRHAEQEQ